MTREEYDILEANNFAGEEFESYPVCRFCPYGKCEQFFGWGCNKAPWEKGECPDEAYIDIPDCICLPETNEFVEMYLDSIVVD